MIVFDIFYRCQWAKHNAFCNIINNRFNKWYCMIDELFDDMFDWDGNVLIQLGYVENCEDKARKKLSLKRQSSIAIALDVWLKELHGYHLQMKLKCHHHHLQYF